MDPATLTSEWLWPNALGVIPVAACVWLICRVSRCRPSTRHAMWLAVLACFLVPPVVPAARLASLLPDVMQHDAGPLRNIERGLPAVPGPSLANQSPSHHERRPAEAPATAGAPLVLPLASVEQRPAGGSPLAMTPSTKDLNAPMAAATPAPPTAVDIAAAPVQTRPHAPAAAPQRGEVAPAPPPTSRRSDPPRREVRTIVAAPADGAGPVTTAPVWSQWLAGAERMRQAAVSLPPVPAAVWLGGAALLGAITFLRIVRFRSILRNAEAAPRGARRLVEEAAAELGLARPPLTLMTDARVSPLIWCLGTPRLILPSALWAELDEGGQRAVVLHELAHLRRRDHWVRWAELAASLLFWWHPVVWWVRARIRDEADYACDAWVTALLPRERRAYAQALLCTQAYLTGASRPPPAVGLGVMSAAAQRLARRLTMVMKDRAGPRLSRWGAVVALALGAAGMAATPLWACPPEKEGQDKRAKARAPIAVTVEPEIAVMATPRAARAPKAPKAPKAPRAVVVAPGTPVAEGATTFEAHMRERAAAAGGGAGAAHGHAHGQGGDDRIDGLNRRLERLERRIEELLRERGPSGRAAPVPAPVPAAGAALSLPGELVQLRASVAEGVGDAVLPRTYRLPQGKLDALVQLMARQDVPIVISRGDDGITVNATTRQHEVFRLFIQMIHPEAPSPAGTLWKASGHEEAHGEPLQATVLAATLAALAAEAETAGAAAGRLEAQVAEIEAQAEALDGQAEALEAAVESLVGEERAVTRQRIGEMRRQVRELERRARGLEREAEHFHERAERCRERAAECEGKHAECEATEAEAEAEVEEDDAQ